jgi:hypothetical protein
VFSDICCKCFYLDVAYVSHICCKSFIWMLHMLHVYCMCFIWMLHMFFNGYTHVFSGVSDVCCKCSNCFRPMLHMLQWDPSVLAAYMRGCGGARVIGMGNGVGTNRDATPMWACTSMGTAWHGAPCEAWLCGGAGRRSRLEHPVASPPSGCPGTRPTEILRACMDTYLFISMHMC